MYRKCLYLYPPPNSIHFKTKWCVWSILHCISNTICRISESHIFFQLLIFKHFKSENQKSLKNTHIPFIQIDQLVTISHICYISLSKHAGMRTHTHFAATFESNLLAWCYFIHKFFSIYLLWTRTFSYMVIIPLSHPRNFM